MLFIFIMACLQIGTFFASDDDAQSAQNQPRRLRITFSVFEKIIIADYSINAVMGREKRDTELQLLAGSLEDGSSSASVLRTTLLGDGKTSEKKVIDRIIFDLIRSDQEAKPGNDFFKLLSMMGLANRETKGATSSNTGANKATPEKSDGSSGSVPSSKSADNQQHRTTLDGRKQPLGSKLLDIEIHIPQSCASVQIELKDLLKDNLEKKLFGYQIVYFQLKEKCCRLHIIPFNSDPKAYETIVEEKLSFYREQGFSHVKLLTKEEFNEKFDNVLAAIDDSEGSTVPQRPSIPPRPSVEPLFTRVVDGKKQQLALQQAKDEVDRKKREEIVAQNRAIKAAQEAERIRQKEQEEADRAQKKLEQDAARNLQAQGQQAEKFKVLEALREKGVSLHDLKENARGLNLPKVLAAIEAVFLDIANQQKLLENCKPKDFKRVFSQNQGIYDKMDTAIANIQSQIREAEQSKEAVAEISTLGKVAQVSSMTSLSKNPSCFCLNSMPAVLGSPEKCFLCRQMQEDSSILDPNAPAFVSRKSY